MSTPAAFLSVVRIALVGLLLAVPISGAQVQAAEVTGDPAAFEILEPTGFENATFYRATRPDPRLCPSPICGGFFVERVNRFKTKCADGKRRDECHAAIIDFSPLGLDPVDEAELLQSFGAGNALARGTLMDTDVAGQAVPTLVVDQAWRGVTETRSAHGRWFGLRPSGINCITHPCPVLVRVKLNSKRHRFLHALDLTSQSDATGNEVSDALESLNGESGLIAFGGLRKITGPAGTGRELVATEFYEKVGEGSPAVCGGFTYPPNPPCGKDEFCEPPAGSCLVADLPGTCEPVPEVCPLVIAPVCGCDGNTYSNDCERQAAGVGLDHEGACSEGEACGFTTCAPWLTCCNPVMGICTPPGQFCIQ